MDKIGIFLLFFVCVYVGYCDYSFVCFCEVTCIEWFIR